MDKFKFAYCNNCEDIVEFVVKEEVLLEEYKGVEINYRFNVGRCKCCNCEVATDTDYNYRKTDAKIEAYKKTVGLITVDEIDEIIKKYDVGKESLSDIMGFGKVTIKRYYEGFFPSKDYSDKLLDVLNDEEHFMAQVKKNEEKLKGVTLRKINERYKRLTEIKKSKIEQIANYIITQMDEVTPLALEKLLYFSNGVNYVLNGSQLIDEELQAWVHGPVYKKMYDKYKHKKYNPINDGIYSTHGCMCSLLTPEEIKSIDLVINTFGLYSPKILENISHTQDPWKEKRVGYKDDEAGNELIDEQSIKNYYMKFGLNSEESIMNYIMDCIKGRDVNVR